MPVWPTTRTRVPAASSGPVASQTESRTLTLIWPGHAGLEHLAEAAQHLCRTVVDVVGVHRRARSEHAAVEEPAGDAGRDRARAEQQELRLQRDVECGRRRAHDQRRKAKPQQVEARDGQFGAEQGEADDAPDPDYVDDHGPLPATCLPAADVIASRTISPMPAIVPVMPAASSGTITIFELGDVPIALSASTYFCATK